MKSTNEALNDTENPKDEGFGDTDNTRRTESESSRPSESDSSFSFIFYKY